MKKRFSTELAYLLGIIILAIGTAFMEKADFGMSMVVAPAYLIHLKVSESLSFFSFGMAEYALQGAILILMMLLLRRARIAYLFSFVTAVLYGFALDGAIALFAFLPVEHMALRFVYYISGMLLCSLGVAFFFKTYIPPEAYELFVKEIAEKLHIEIGRFKTLYDVASCLIGVILSFAFFGFGRFEGVKAGTIVCALINGSVISAISSFMDKKLSFTDSLPLRKLFASSK